MGVRVWADSTATIGICGRRRLGKLRHIDTQCVWIHQKVRNKAVELRKISGEMIPADLFTKHLSRDEMVFHMTNLGYRMISDKGTELGVKNSMDHLSSRETEEVYLGEDLNREVAAILGDWGPGPNRESRRTGETSRSNPAYSIVSDKQVTSGDVKVIVISEPG